MNAYKVYTPNVIDLHNRSDQLINDMFKTGKMSGVGRGIIIMFVGFSMWILQYRFAK